MSGESRAKGEWSLSGGSKRRGLKEASAGMLLANEFRNGQKWVAKGALSLAFVFAP